jgi:hypothetical protein
MISDINRAANNRDDIIVFDKENGEHNEALKKILDRFQESGLKLKKNKCTFRVTETPFLGHLISADGIKAGPRKIEAILKMSTPNNQTELQRPLGMINYLGQYLPNVSNEMALLYVNYWEITKT